MNPYTTRDQPDPPPPPCTRHNPRLFDPRLFDPPHGTRKTTDRITYAKAICQPCPARNTCLEDGIRETASGVRGGQLLADGRIVNTVGKGET